MVPIKTAIAARANYGVKRSTSNIKFITVHGTANDGDSDESNGSYFQRNIKKASANFFVDDDSITQSVPDNYVAYSVGGKKWNNAGGRLYGTVTNSNSISIELCDTVRNGVVYPSEKTIQNALELVKFLMQKYNIPVHRVIRHYDVNGKTCPSYWVNDNEWEKCFHSKLTGEVRPVSGPDVNPYKEPSVAVTSAAIGKKKKINFCCRGNDVKWVQWELCQVSESFKQMIKDAGGIDGVCGDTTVSCIKAFQKMYGLTADGICGANTRKGLKQN